MKAFSFKLLAVLLALLPGLLTLEIYLRIMNPMVVRVQGDRIQLPVKQTFVVENVTLRDCDRVVVHHKNALGFRGAEPPLDTRGWLTLFAVGGSTTECFYLSDGETWPELVSQALQGHFQHFWMNNAGLDGQSTFGHYVLVRDALGPLHPQVVLFLVGVNDVERDDLTGPDGAMSHAEPSNPVYRLLSHSYTWNYLINLSRGVRAWKKKLTHANVDPKTTPTLVVTDAQVQETLRRQTPFLSAYAKRLQDLIDLCRQERIEPVLLTQPALYGDAIDPDTHVSLAALKVRNGVNGHLAWKVLELYNAQTREVAERNGLLLIDLAKTMPKRSGYFYDFIHFTRHGAIAVAEIVSPTLQRWLTQRYPAWVAASGT